MKKFVISFLCAAFALFSGAEIFAQPTRSNSQNQVRNRGKVRSVTIPISFRTKNGNQNSEEIINAGTLTVRENGDEQEILSLRSVESTPLTLGILLQDDADTQVNLQLEDLKRFIRQLPQGSRVMIGYLRAGNLDIRQKFTEDLNRAADSVRIVVGSPAVAPFNPFDGVAEAISRFESQPLGRRALLVVSDGVDTSRGVFSPSDLVNSIDLERAVSKAQRRSVAVYNFYADASQTRNNRNLALLGQSALQKLSDETGGRAYFSGTSTAVSFQPFFRDLNLTLTRQFALTYLSTHPKKGFYRVDVTSSNPSVVVEHPRGYNHR